VVLAFGIGIPFDIRIWRFGDTERTNIRQDNPPSKTAGRQDEQDKSSHLIIWQSGDLKIFAFSFVVLIFPFWYLI
jgi:hypothetical protein